VFDVPKALALILDGWVRMLVFASVRCSRDAHASQINRGGELMTVVWLMEEHANMFFKQPTPNGIESFLLQPCVKMLYLLFPSLSNICGRRCWGVCLFC
jgi:hypothetical protein